MNELINNILDNLSDDLLKPVYLKMENRNKYTGHCYVATETLYHLLDDEDKKKYRPAILKVNGDTHWFLINVDDGTIVDLTKDQFDFNLDYQKARFAAFLTKNPSKRSLILMNRINEKDYCW